LGTFILPDNFGHCIKVEENCHLCPNIFGHSGKIQIFFALPEKNRADYRGREIFCCCSSFWVHSHMKECMLGRTTLEAAVKPQGAF